MNELRKAFQFFFQHAGYCVGSRAIGALALARAEREAYSHEPEYGSLTASWHGDDSGSDTWGDHEYWCAGARRGECEGHETLYCKVTYFNPETRRVETLASVGGVIDPDASYCRVIEAELFSEALAILDQRYADSMKNVATLAAIGG